MTTSVDFLINKQNDFQEQIKQMQQDTAKKERKRVRKRQWKHNWKRQKNQGTKTVNPLRPKQAAGEKPLLWITGPF